MRYILEIGIFFMSGDIDFGLAFFDFFSLIVQVIRDP